MLKLPNVTLCCLTGINYKRQEHLDALWKSQEGIKFGEVKLIEIDWVKSIDDWNKAIIYELPKYIGTDYSLLIHADGYVRNPDCFDWSWLDYDYVGAPWPLPTDDFSYRDRSGVLQRVGNSVSLRSKRLMDLANDKGLEWKAFHGYTNEDGFICVNYRHVYEEAGMKFAPLEVAKYFSKEHEIPENKDIKTFAFHSTA